MKVYVWEDCLVRWAPGTAVVVANSEEEARELVRRSLTDYYCGGSLFRSDDEYVIERVSEFMVDFAKAPRVIEEPEALLAWGSE